MDRLILFRHGDAERDSASGEDIDRRLTARGRREAAEMGETLADLGLTPDLVLVSAAARTRETWEAAEPALPPARVRFEAELYLAEAEAVREAAEAAGKGVATVLVVGHNPGLQELTVRLLAEAGADAMLIARAQTLFPTGAAAAFLIDARGRAAPDGLFYPGRGT